MLCNAMRRVETLEELQKVCPVNMVKGKKTDEGYDHLGDIDVSVQGQDANGACRAIVTAAQTLGIAVEIGFMWRHKEGAAFPGEQARLHSVMKKVAIPLFRYLACQMIIPVKIPILPSVSCELVHMLLRKI